MTRIFAARTAAAFFVFAGLTGSCIASAQSEEDRAEALAQGLDGSLQTERYAVFWRTEEASAADIHELGQVLDTYYDGISTLVGPERTPQRRIVVVLGGEAELRR